eukprot:CAMPEP_0203649030 /NCGR_PEP_ID=MMETSP0088-20131115/20714_1 /ASSEMBLY_ACC=CAM_ASM_001087 /TAXON_ID=426623 /ORGANISM="Chaetoceros affinis, Strain CCMP159" /LENGTH=138 /DNA_ID=CAMNT_0050507285 /DNA_START=36 /DNA_END=452 /DNA_ORIENTATION=+
MARVTRSSTRSKAQPGKDENKIAVAKKTTITKKKVEKTVAKTVVKDESGGTFESDKIVSVDIVNPEAAFKSRAAKIKKAVGNKAAVEINKEKPGKGNFIIRISGIDNPIVELKEMKRPFKPLKELDMEDVIEKVLAAI